MTVFFVGVADVDEALRRAEELGGRTVQPATSVPGVTFDILADPQGQMVGVVSQGSRSKRPLGRARVGSTLTEKVEVDPPITQP